MTILLTNGAVFLHIPKTGGIYIHAVLDALGLVKAPLGHEHADFDRAFWNDRYHCDAKVLRHILRRAAGFRRAPATMAPDAFRFCFVREPLKWYESYWRYMQSLNWREWGDELDPCRWHPNAMLNGLGSSDFNEFIYNVNRKRPGYVTELFSWYVRPGVQFVGKQENLISDLRRVLASMKVDVDVNFLRQLPHVNAVASNIPTPEWDPVLREKTLRLEYAAYVRYGYAVSEEQDDKISYFPGLPYTNGHARHTGVDAISKR